MEEAPGKNYLPWMLAIAGVFVFLNIDSMWNASVDVAQHYALAFRISEQWVLSSKADPSLGVMNIYPRGSHVIAAMLGFLLSSTFLGIQLTTLVSLALLWLCAILVLNSLPGRMARISLATFTGLTLINSQFTKLDVHWHEIVVNFFYAQLVGHAILFASIALAINLEKRLGVIWSVFALAILMLMNATIHLLPATEMLGLIVGLLVVYVVFDRRTKSSNLARTALAVAIALASMGALFLHPSLSAMQEISKNDGYLWLRNVPYPFGLVILCLVVVIASLILFFQWIKSADGRETLAAKYVAIYGAVTAGLCLLQYALTFLGHGSDYAVKKYGFGLTSILLLQLSMIVSGYLCSSRMVPAPSNGFGSRAFHPLALFCAFVAALFLYVPGKKALDVSNVVSLERKLINLADTLLPVPEDQKDNVVIGLRNMPPMINYLFSIAITRTHQGLVKTDVYKNDGLAKPSNYSYIISWRGNKSFGSAGCESISKGALSIVSGQCVESRILAASSCKRTFDFTLEGSIPPGLLRGFSSPEQHGRWSDGDHASFECIAGDGPVSVLKLQVAPFVHGSMQGQRIEVSLNGRPIYKEMLSAPRDANNPIIIEIPQSMGSGKYVLDFRFPDARSPEELGVSGDSRKLGFSFRRVTFE